MGADADAGQSVVLPENRNNIRRARPCDVTLTRQSK